MAKELRDVARVAVDAFARATFGPKRIVQDAGISYATVQSWRAGRKSPTATSLHALAATFRDHAATLGKLADQLDNEAARLD